MSDTVGFPHGQRYLNGCFFFAHLFSGGETPEVNQEGVAYYNNLINGLLKKG